MCQTMEVASTLKMIQAFVLCRLAVYQSRASMHRRVYCHRRAAPLTLTQVAVQLVRLVLCASIAGGANLQTCVEPCEF